MYPIICNQNQSFCSLQMPSGVSDICGLIFIPTIFNSNYENQHKSCIDNNGMYPTTKSVFKVPLNHPLLKVYATLSYILFTIPVSKLDSKSYL